ncbi:HTH-type transcriptional regulator IscR [Caprobacter fermentans]|uniref:HTH-type transcriptional regulator IscR n=1 Tax=Caproicibacter fermentans TaxID=2576756 RepID=A0A6N8I688_9FIRM|nr:Rrf2 family transcriptional regulator [Caproicibacter fermentans]MVB13023.1 HTH-type transcriptional regulator IscR [Caproicibacter fermentans]OCN02447.1 Rrf2 family transcriptional regulator [Clostridium sp. W14A]QNK41287.1 Rrf2 family transcriptional regulator [Caproicibacter fermentans]
MVLTLEADYAVRIVDDLAQSDRKVDARTLSEHTRVPLRFALKILRKLVASGLIVSYKGAHGGYMLAGPADSITLRQVIESVEGPYMLSRCQQDAYSCTHDHCCRFHEIYDEISTIVREKLDSYTFDTLNNKKKQG